MATQIFIRETLKAYAGARISRRHAMRELGLADYRELAILMGIHGYEPKVVGNAPELSATLAAGMNG